MAKPMIESTLNGFAIRIGGRNGQLWVPPGYPEYHYASFETRSKARNFLKRGGHIEVQVLSITDASGACGWDDTAGYCEANFARMNAWCEREGVHYYSREKEEFFISEAIREAQERGLSKVVVENLS